MKRTLLLALLFTVAYLLVFSSPVPKEPVFAPRWAQDLTNPSQIAGANSRETVGFRIGRVFGYVTPEGAVRYLDTASFNVAISDRRFINFSSVSQNLVEKDTSGRIMMTVDSQGYPILAAGRLFLIDTDRMAISELDNHGAVLWRREFGSIVTSIGANAASVVVGLLDGRLLVLDKRGRVAYSYLSGGSKIPVIYGCAVSADGEYLAAVSGLDPQRFILFRRSASTYRPRRIVDLAHAQRRQVFIHFYPRIPYVYVESPGAIDYFALQGNGSGRVPVAGQVAGMAAGNGPLIYAVSTVPAAVKGGRIGSAQLTIFSPSGGIVARSGFAGSQLFLKAAGDAVYLGANRELMRFDYMLE